MAHNQGLIDLEDQPVAPQHSVSMSQKYFSFDILMKVLKVDQENRWRTLSKEKERYDQETLIVLARVAEQAEDYKTMQTYIKLFID